MSIKRFWQKIPGIDNKNVRLYYLFSYIHESFFTEGNWIYLFLMFFNYSELGILDAITLGIGMILEIPTGAIADLIGKKKTIQISFFTVLLSLILMSFAPSGAILYLGNVLLFIGLAIYSGAADAFVYDAVQTVKSTTNFDKVFAFSKSLKSVAFILAAGIGAIAATFNPRYPFILWGVTFLIGTIASFQMKEIKVKHPKFNFKHYCEQILIGSKQLLKPALKPYLAFIFIVLGMDYMYGWGFLKPAILLSFNFNALSMGAIFVISGCITALTIGKLPKLRKLIPDYLAVVALSLSMIMCLYLFTLNSPVVGFITAIIISLTGIFAYTWINIIINEKVESGYRATTLSTVAMILKLPLIILSPFAGAIINAGYLSYLLIGMASIMLLEVATTMIIHRQQLLAR